MSLYRFARATAVLAVLRRYRARLLRIGFAASFALVSAWAYGDIADFLARHQPAWSAVALLVKTVIIYGCLFYGFWQIARMFESREEPGTSPPEARTAGRSQQAESAQRESAPSRLDALVDKPRLRSRRQDILQDHGDQ